MSAGGPAPGGRADDPRAFGSAVAAALATLGAVSGLYLGPIILRHVGAPLGFDAPFYIHTANAATVQGLSDLGTIRAANPLLLASLMRASGQNAFTVVAVAQTVFSVIISLGAAAMARAALGLRAVWFPVIGLLLWAAFGYNGIYLHLDNLLNGALVLSGFAVAVAMVGWKKGWLALTVLFMAAGLAHWPFYVYSMAIFGLALVAYALLSRRERDHQGLRAAMRLGGAVAASAVFVGLTFLSVPAGGWLGLRLDPKTLRARFLRHVHERPRYLVLPLAAVGVTGAVRTPSPPASPAGRRLFLCLVGGWIVVTVAAGAAQGAGYPTAGGRALNFFFALPLLGGLGLWAVGRLVAGLSTRALSTVAAVMVVLGLLAGFVVMAWHLRYGRATAFDRGGLTQTTSAASYVAGVDRAAAVYFVFVPGRNPPRPHNWELVQATLPPDLVVRARPYVGTVQEFLGARPSRGLGTEGQRPPSGSVGVLLQRYNRAPFADASRASPERVLAEGVYVVAGPLPSAPLPDPNPPRLASPWVLVSVTVLVFAMVTVAGGGWALALLPSDALVQVAVAPGLGLAFVALVALAWDRVGLPYAGWGALGPLVLATAGGWALAFRRPPRAEPADSVVT